MKLLISIPVYELDNAIEIIHNVLKYTKDSYIILHNNLNSNFSNDALRNISDRVIINEERLPMISPHSNSPNSLWDIIQSNIKAALHLEWSYIILLTSNTRFVVNGIEEFLEKSNYDAGYSVIPEFNFKYNINIIQDNKILSKCKELLPQCSKFFYDAGYSDNSFNTAYINNTLSVCRELLPQFSKFFYDSEYNNIPINTKNNTEITNNIFPHGNTLSVCKELLPQCSKFFYGNVDGSFINRDIAISFLDYKCIYKSIITAPQEIIIPTIIKEKTNKIGEVVTYTDWNNNMIVTQEIIDQVQKGTFLGFFCVKRINMNNPLRNYILNT
jgi:hypothetical protein